MWVEKYRPKLLEQIVDAPHELHAILNSSMLASIPHLLIYGPAGTGKSSAVRIICKHVFQNCKLSSEFFRERVLELNASDDRGTKVIRESIKFFAGTAINVVKDVPNIKLVILEEADALAEDAQAALRRIMETYSHNTRFIFVCNYIGNIIKPLVSRCLKIQFKPCKDIRPVVDTIEQGEGLEIQNKEEFITILQQKCTGDLRKVIHTLQQLYFDHGKMLTPQMLNYVPIKLSSNSSWKQLDNQIREASRNAINPRDIVQDIFMQFMQEPNVNPDKIIRLAKTDHYLAIGGDMYIQLMALMSSLKQLN